MVKVEGLGEVIARIEGFKKKFSREERLRINQIRAESFRDFMQTALRSGSLMLTPIKDPSHPPLYDTGQLAQRIITEVDTDGVSVNVGFFAKNGDSPPGSRLTYTQLAILHSHGFHAGTYKVPPRPFMSIGLRRYKDEKIDNKIVKRESKNV